MNLNMINTVSVSAVRAKGCGIQWETITLGEGVVGEYMDQWCLH